jgi:uncharacterized protein YjiS (DUF1127 family)
MDVDSFEAFFPITSETPASSGTADRSHNDNSARTSAIRTMIAAFWNGWRNEREIQRAVRRLALLDDNTLRDLGIRDRSEIEFTVRFCRIC